MACENNKAGRYQDADGDVDACIRYQKENGRSFATYWKDECYGSATCSKPYCLSGAVNYEVKHCSGNSCRK